MLFLPMNYLTNLQTVPKADRKILAYGILCAMAIAAGVTWVVASSEPRPPPAQTGGGWLTPEIQQNNAYSDITASSRSGSRHRPRQSLSA